MVLFTELLERNEVLAVHGKPDSIVPCKNYSASDDQ